MTNAEKILTLIRKHSEGLDDDELAKMTGIQPRQQVHQICSRLAASGLIRRESIEKQGKRRKVHNFAVSPPPVSSGRERQFEAGASWNRRLKALVAATGRTEDALLDEALQDLAIKVLKSADS